MADEPLPVTDPYQIPVVFVNSIAGSGILNGCCNLTFSTARFTPKDGKIDPDMVVTARLRLDLFCVQQLHDTLGKILAQNVKTSSIQ